MMLNDFSTHALPLLHLHNLQDRYHIMHKSFMQRFTHLFRTLPPNKTSHTNSLADNLGDTVRRGPTTALARCVSARSAARVATKLGLDLRSFDVKQAFILRIRFRPRSGLPSWSFSLNAAIANGDAIDEILQKRLLALNATHLRRRHHHVRAGLPRRVLEEAPLTGLHQARRTTELPTAAPTTAAPSVRQTDRRGDVSDEEHAQAATTPAVII